MAFFYPASWALAWFEMAIPLVDASAATSSIGKPAHDRRSRASSKTSLPSPWEAILDKIFRHRLYPHVRNKVNPISGFRISIDKTKQQPSHNATALTPLCQPPKQPRWLDYGSLWARPIGMTTTAFARTAVFPCNWKSIAGASNCSN